MDGDDYDNVTSVKINVMTGEGLSQVIVAIPESHMNSDCREAYAEGVGDGAIALLKVLQPDMAWAREDPKIE